MADGSDGEVSDISAAKAGSVQSLATAASTVTLEHVSKPRDTTCIGKTKRFFKGIYKVVRSVVGLIIILIVYSFLGALMFQHLEGASETDIRPAPANLSLERIELLSRLQTIFADASSTPESWQTDAEYLIESYERMVKKVGLYEANPEKAWSFWNALIFTGTVYTTIGYGHIVPKTDAGRGMCVLYAAIGIPLALLVLAELGKKFTVALKFLWAFVRRYKNTGKCWKIRKPLSKKYTMAQDDVEADTKSVETRSRSGSRIVLGYEVDDEFNLPISIALIILLVYIFLGALMYSQWEHWDFMTATYFVFISISTIGFGDVLPDHPKFFILSSIYMFIGLSLVSMCVNVAIEFFSKQAEIAKARMEGARKKMTEAKSKFGEKVQQAGRNAKERVAVIKKDIQDETTKLRNKTDEKFRKHGPSRSRSNTPISHDTTPVKEQPGEDVHYEGLP